MPFLWTMRWNVLGEPGNLAYFDFHNAGGIPMHILPQPWQPFACRVGRGTEEVEVVEEEGRGGEPH